MSITIKKVKLTKSRTLEVTLSEEVTVNGMPVTNEVVKKCEYLAHQDLIDALTQLAPHMVNICELMTPSEELRITGFSISENSEGGGVTIVASKTLTNGKVLNLVSPFTDFFSEDYSLSEELQIDMNDCVREVELYINEGKSAIRQASINFDEDDEAADVQISTGNEPKKRGRKKNSMTISVNGGEEIPVEFDKAI